MSSKNRQLEQSIAELGRDKKPERDLWPGIEMALLKQDTLQHAAHSAPQNTKWRNALALAASLCIVAVVAFGAFYGGQRTNAAQLVERISQQHQQQKASLLVSFEGMSTNTDNWRQQLNDLAEAEKAIKEALEDSPNNPALLSMLKHVYQQELAIIERVHAPAWQAI